MGSLWTANLTPDETERYAYLQGNPMLACYAGEFADCEFQIDGFDDVLDAAKEQAFEEGKAEGMGLDTAEKIEDLEKEISNLQASHQRCRNNLQAVLTWLQGDDCKTVKSRQAFEKRLLAALHVTPRY